ncbi:hypothetical protein PV08_04369 [Exophiala spinifera]|uniref:A1 cistron-splicing factor AAR2 n=1 Tax=Exophiala spinifera TaxID=91928 RepID=A0A0D2BDY8_9EURO|nr:uncharacterized protein PV08_04369 [Exophiala spinifera]KIW17178.1 hypothetical protein PV08_04369 [Exophiala spinifera]
MDSPTILILSLPPKTFIGLDLLSFTSAPNFHGVSNVTPGLHFVYSGTDASLSIRHGRWVNITSQSQTQVLQWSAATESLDLLDPTCAPARSAINTISSQGLVDYSALQDATSDLSSHEASNSQAHRSATGDDDRGDERGESTDWRSMIFHVSPSLLTRILSPAWAVSSISSAPSDTETIPGLSHLEASDAFHQSPLNLLPVDLKQTWADEDIGRTRTDRARDRSWYLGHLIQSVTPPGSDRAVGAKQVIGELQFCFLMVLTLANYSCLEQWKRLLSVIFSCQSSLREAEAFFVEVLKVFRRQVAHIDDVEGGLFEMRDEGGSAWLRKTWGRFRATVDEVLTTNEQDKGQPDSSREEAALKKEVEQVQTLFEQKYGWASEKDILRRGMLELEDGERIEVSMLGADEDEETGEYAPVVVDT